MDDQQTDAGQRRDALLRRLLKSPPLSRAETAEAIRRAKGKVKRKRTNGGKSAAMDVLG